MFFLFIEKVKCALKNFFLLSLLTNKQQKFMIISCNAHESSKKKINIYFLNLFKNKESTRNLWTGTYQI